MYEARIHRLEQELRESRTEVNELRMENQRLIEIQESQNAVVEEIESPRGVIESAQIVNGAETQRYAVRDTDMFEARNQITSTDVRNDLYAVKAKKSYSPSPGKRTVAKKIKATSKYNKPEIKPYKTHGVIDITQ